MFKGVFLKHTSCVLHALSNREAIRSCGHYLDYSAILTLRNVHEDSHSRTFSVSGIVHPDVGNYSRYAIQRRRINLTIHGDSEFEHLRRSSRGLDGLLNRSQLRNH
jgi:hypothetical protein